MISFCNKKWFSTTSLSFKLNIESYLSNVENPSPQKVYKQLLEENKLQLDDKQAHTVNLLDSLHYKLSGYKINVQTQGFFNKVYLIFICKVYAKVHLNCLLVVFIVFYHLKNLKIFSKNHRRPIFFDVKFL